MRWKREYNPRKGKTYGNIHPSVDVVLWMSLYIQYVQCWVERLFLSAEGHAILLKPSIQVYVTRKSQSTGSSREKLINFNSIPIDSRQDHEARAFFQYSSDEVNEKTFLNCFQWRENGFHYRIQDCLYTRARDDCLAVPCHQSSCLHVSSSSCDGATETMLKSASSPWNLALPFLSVGNWVPLQWAIISSAAATILKLLILFLVIISVPFTFHRFLDVEANVFPAYDVRLDSFSPSSCAIIDISQHH